MLKKSLLLSILLLGTQLFAAPKVITIAGTADLQGMMEPAIQKFDLNGNGKKEKVSMGGIARIAGTFESIKKENELSISTENGVYKESVFTNVMRLEFPDSSQYALLVLMEGSLSGGQLLDLRYNLADNKLQAVRIYDIGANDLWKVDDLFSTINTDN